LEGLSEYFRLSAGHWFRGYHICTDLLLFDHEGPLFILLEVDLLHFSHGIADGLGSEFG
jgi:hypothetical protein